MTRKQLLDECKTIFVAGHTTSALSITWAFFLLATHPEWQQHRLRKEVHDVGADADNFSNLKQMDMFMREVYRLYAPVANILRECQQPHKIGDIAVVPVTLVTIPILLMHQIREYWGDNFDQFNPERWENKSAYSREMAAYCTFGAGPRFCLGKEFALMETSSLLSATLSQFVFSLSPAYRHAPGQVQTTRPMYGMQLFVRELEG